MKKVGICMLAMSVAIALCGCTGGTDNSEYTSSRPDTAMSSEPTINDATESPFDENDPIEDTTTQQPDTFTNLPYHELAFSADDFKFAGYSVTDGDHYNEVYNMVSETLIKLGAYNPTNCWLYSLSEWESGKITTFYYKGYESYANNSANITYYVNDLSWAYDAPHTEITLTISYNDTYVGEQIVDDYPLLESTVLPEMRRDEVLTRLNLMELVSIVESGGLDVSYIFESQYGETSCTVSQRNGVSKNWTHGTSVAIEYSNVRFFLVFKEDTFLSISCTATYT